MLKDWQSLNLAGIWQIRLSGILFEIGEYLKAEEIARQALVDIRSRLRPHTLDYSLLSQEGIAMMMLETIEQINNGERLFDRSKQERLDVLQTYQCNPRIELDWLQNVCQGDLPQPKPRKEVKESFDPGYFHTSCRSTEDYITLSDLRPGFELVMMREEIGISPIMFKSSIPKTVQWIECYYPLWAIEVLMRCQNEEGIKEYFDHIAIENLETSNIETIYNWLLSRMDNSMKRMKANKYSENYQDKAWISFGTSLEVLSRILSRIQDEQVTQIFKIILGCISDYKDRQLVQIRNTIRSFWQRFFERLSNIDILNIMKDLLTIPLPSNDIFDEGNHAYLEPFIKIKWKNNFLLPEEFDRSSWDIEISKLITNVNHNDNITREYSLLRLSELISINALDEQEQKNLASALWLKLDEITGLPLVGSHCLRKSDLLYFPELEANKGKAVDLIRKHILSSEFPSLSLNSQITGKIISNLDLLINSSSHLLVQSDCIVKHGIIWTGVEINALANKIFQFAINSVEILSLQEDYTFLFDDDLRKIKSRIVSFLTLLILPSWKNLDDNSKEIVLSLSSKIIKSWGSQSQTLISLVQIEDLDKDRLSGELKNKIYSSSLDLIEDGAKGIYNWLIYYHSSIEVPEPPRELIDSTISLFVSRRHPGFDLYLRLILSLITAIPDLLDTNQLAQILLGVEYILAETTLTKRGKRDKYIIPNQKCRLYRGLAYDIAYQLDLIYSIKFPDFHPSIITQWKEISTNEIWPEIKSLWKQN